MEKERGKKRRLKWPKEEERSGERMEMKLRKGSHLNNIASSATAWLAEPWVT
jgi:hypothetical protein